MGQDFDARRANHAARWGAASGAASAPAPAPAHNRISLSPGPGLPAAGADNDRASAGMADGSVDNNMVPPLPPTPSDASRDAPLVISSDGITLSAEFAGMDESHFRKPVEEYILSWNSFYPRIEYIHPFALRQQDKLPWPVALSRIILE